MSEEKKTRARRGKIARLPREIREKLNHRMADGEPASTLLPWLNGLRGVQAELKRYFGGAAVTVGNLTEWRAGGFADWQAHQEAREQTRDMLADAEELCESADGKLGDGLGKVLAARYAVALANWNGEVTEEFREKCAP